VSIVTISAIKADTCACVGHFAVHQHLIAEARRRRVKAAVTRGVLIDTNATPQVAERMHERWAPIEGRALIHAWR
jgi:fructose 1,6-bisphosphatase